MLALSFWLAYVILPSLGDYPLLSDDEGEILFVAHTLATDGRLGTDLYQGIWNTDHRLFITPPVQSILIAGAFRSVGENIFNARVVSFLSALVVLWCVGYLARCWYGEGVMLTATFLLVSWRFINPARTARYDMTAVAWMWLTLVALNLYLHRRSARWILLTGIFAGLATLTQFFGGFILGVIALVLWREGRGRAANVRALLFFLIGLAILLAPYALYVFSDYDNFVLQTFVLKPARTRFGDWMFYAQNLANEMSRYGSVFARSVVHATTLTERVTASILLIAIGAAMVLLLRQLWREREASRRIVPLSLLVIGGSLALFDSAKVPYYAIALLPFVYIAVGMLWRAIYDLRATRAYRAMIIACSVLIAVGFMLRYSDALVADRIAAATTSPYPEMLARIRTELPRDARILTSARLAWGLRDFSVSATSLPALRARAARLDEWLAQTRTDHFVLDERMLIELEGDTEWNAQMAEIRVRCAARIAEWRDPSYQTIQIYRVRLPCAP